MDFPGPGIKPVSPALPIGFPGGSVLKNPLANAGDAGDMGLISGLEDPLE